MYILIDCNVVMWCQQNVMVKSRTVDCNVTTKKFVLHSSSLPNCIIKIIIILRCTYSSIHAFCWCGFENPISSLPLILPCICFHYCPLRLMTWWLDSKTHHFIITFYLYTYCYCSTYLYRGTGVVDRLMTDSIYQNHIIILLSARYWKEAPVV